MILGGVNFGTTFFGLYVVERFGRRKSLIYGALWMFMCFMVFASIGHFALNQKDPTLTPQAGTAMIVFACFFIAAFASTWGPIIWAVVGEIYPSRYRAICMAMAIASNWIWNFLISFFTPFITAKIDFRYGYVFASCCFAGAVVVYFFLCESQGRTLEEIDTMYVLKVDPRKSAKWEAPEYVDVKNPEQALRQENATQRNGVTNSENRETTA
jgi:MFS transporter, SP family, sugar:H+ symporter